MILYIYIYYQKMPNNSKKMEICIFKIVEKWWKSLKTVYNHEKKLEILKDSKMVRKM